MSSFMLEVSKGGNHLGLLSTIDKDFVEELTKLLRKNGYGIRILHQPSSVIVNEEKGGGGAK